MEADEAVPSDADAPDTAEVNQETGTSHDEEPRPEGGESTAIPEAAPEEPPAPVEDPVVAAEKQLSKNIQDLFEGVEAPQKEEESKEVEEDIQDVEAEAEVTKEEANETKRLSMEEDLLQKQVSQIGEDLKKPSVTVVSSKVKKLMSLDEMIAKDEEMKKTRSDFTVIRETSFETMDGERTESGPNIEVEEKISEQEVERVSAEGVGTTDGGIEMKKSKVKFGTSSEIIVDVLMDELGKEQSKEKIRERPSGDFGYGQDEIFGFDTVPVESFTEVEASARAAQAAEFEGEEEGSVEEEEPSILDRYPYYIKFVTIKDEHTKEKIKNNFLQKKMTEYYKKRHMEHVLKEHMLFFDSHQKYFRLLDKMGELLELKRNEMEITRAEIAEMTHERDTSSVETQKMFKSLLDKERDTGMGTIYRKTGNPIADKYVEYLIRRQKNKVKEMADLRLSFIKLRNMVLEREDQLKKIETIAEGLTLQYYEQLKLDNRTRADKIEIQDNEMTKLRTKIRETLNILAHTREKLAAMSLDVVDLGSQMEEVDMDLIMCRERLGSFRMDRDEYRKAYHKMKENSGLLCENKLLADFQASMEEVDELHTELENLKRETIVTTEEVRELRKRLEEIKKKGRDRSDFEFKHIRKLSRSSSRLGKSEITIPDVPL